MTEQKIDLAAEGLLNPDQPTTESQQKPDEPPGEDDFVEYVSKLMLGLQESMGNLHIGIRMMSERISLLEKYVSYLLEKDPAVGEKIKAIAAKAKLEAETAAQAAQADAKA